MVVQEINLLPAPLPVEYSAAGTACDATGQQLQCIA